MTPGVYRIRNAVNGRAYVGSSARCLFARLLAHFRDLERGGHHNAHLQYAWLRYGASAFVFEVVEVVDPAQFADRFALAAHVVRREQRAFDALPAFLRYNVDDPVDTKIGTAMPRAARKAIGDFFRGKPLSDAHKEKLREANKGQGVGRKLPPETRAKMSAARKGKKLTDEHRANVSKGWRRGKTYSEEHLAFLAQRQAYRDKKNGRTA